MVNSSPRVLYARERNHFERCLVHNRAVLNTATEITFPELVGNPAPVVHLAAIHFTDRSIPVYLQNVFYIKSHK
jgi:hypothetical protein